MPRNTNISAHAKYNTPFPTMLRTLLKDRAVTQDELAAVLSVKRQTVGRYTDGSASPSYDSLVAIASFFGVTTDYLLGASDTPSIEIEDKFLTDKVKFSPAAVGRLKAYVTGRSSRMAALSALLEQDDFDYILDDVAHCLEIGSYKTTLEQVLDDHNLTPSEYEAALIKDERLKDKNTTTYDATYKLGKICENLIKASESQEGIDGNVKKEHS